MELGDKIRMLRKQQHMTLEEVGNIVGVGKSTVRKWESGAIANMRRDKIALLARALHVTPGYLMGWENEDEPPALSSIPPVSSLTPDETNLLDNYRMLNTEGKSIARTTVQSLAANPDLRKDTSSETA